jgi:hypothetical protein
LLSIRVRFNSVSWTLFEPGLWARLRSLGNESWSPASAACFERWDGAVHAGARPRRARRGQRPLLVSIPIYSISFLKSRCRLLSSPRSTADVSRSREFGHFVKSLHVF